MAELKDLYPSLEERAANLREHLGLQEDEGQWIVVEGVMYLTLEQIGAGGFGHVFRAIPEKTPFVDV